MRGLRTKENDKFINFFKIVQKKANADCKMKLDI